MAAVKYTRTIARLARGGDILVNKRDAGGHKRIELVAPRLGAFFPQNLIYFKRTRGVLSRSRTGTFLNVLFLILICSLQRAVRRVVTTLRTPRLCFIAIAPFSARNKTHVFTLYSRETATTSLLHRF